MKTLSYQKLIEETTPAFYVKMVKENCELKKMNILF